MEINIENNNNIKLKMKCKGIFYEIKISLVGEEIYFKYKPINGNLYKSQNFSFEKFQTISNFFTIFDNINEIFQSIKDIILFQNPDLILEDKKFLYFTIYPNLGKYNFIEIPLNKEYIIETKKVDENFLTQIEEDIKKFDSFIDSYENQIKELENENKELQLKIKNYEETILNNNNKYNEIFYYNINDSYENFVLIQSKYKLIKFNKLLISEKNFNKFIFSKMKNKKINFELIYKAIIDGDKAKTFHNNVDGKGPLIILVKTSNNNIIGGYTSKPWSSSNKYMKDSEAFLFSLTNEKLYKITLYEFACLHLENCGPCFGNNGELKIVDNCFTEDSWVTNDSVSYDFEFYFINKKNLIGEKEFSTFKVQDYEVYQIVSNN